MNIARTPKTPVLESTKLNDCEATFLRHRLTPTEVVLLPRGELGRIGEMHAAEYLRQHGYKIIAQNWRLGTTGEVDIVATKNGCVVFVEVKTRRRMSADDALAAVTEDKLSRIRKLAAAWIFGQSKFDRYRLDVIGVQMLPRVGFEWLKDVGQ